MDYVRLSPKASTDGFRNERAVLLDRELDRREPSEFAGFIPEDLVKLGIRIGELPVLDRADPNERLADDTAELRLGLPQRARDPFVCPQRRTQLRAASALLLQREGDISRESRIVQARHLSGPIDYSALPNISKNPQ